MPTAPQINFFDNSGITTNLVVTTNQFNLIFTGTVDSNTIDLQINVNGAGFVSDPSLVGLVVPNFTVPNLASFPNGLPLSRGQNVIQLRAIDLSGAVSSISSVTATVIPDTDLQTIQVPPTGVQLQRNASSITLTWVDTIGEAAGFNVYASTGQGGTESGYLLINSSMIPASTPTETTIDEFPTFSWTYDFTDDSSLDLQIVASTVDPVTGAVVEQKTQNTAPLIQSPNYRYTTSVSTLLTTKRYTFTHDRDASLASGILNNDIFSSVLPSDPLFYVVTAVYYDSTTGVLQESKYSPELSGSPLPLNTIIKGISIRDAGTVAQDYINEIQKSNPTLALIPGSTEREVHIEPFSNEIQKAYFLADFVHRAKSFPALLAIDDPNLTGTSVPVAQSQYKQALQTALSINDATATQALIDGAFDSLAANFGKTRAGPKASSVTQTFFTTVKPTQDLVVNQGAVVSSSSNPSAPRFTSKAIVTMFVSRIQSYYNPVLRRYEITSQMVADAPGSVGNLPAGSLDTVSSGAAGFQTTNVFSSDFGTDLESNLGLAQDAMRAIPSVDTGTEGGYNNTSIGNVGALDVSIVKSGDPEMMRDYDPIRQKHIGGKVDIYVKGIIERTVNETFAFQFNEANNVRFDVIDAANLIFRARDSRLTVSNPIQQMLFSPSQNLGLRNHSDFPTASYDLTGYQILDFQTIQLSNLIPQPETNLDDFIEGDYRFRSNNKFMASLQPIRRVTSIVGTVSGALDSTVGYSLFKIEDPLLNGESTAASDYVIINQIGNVPSGQEIQINDEQHVLIGQFAEPLGAVGINIFTINVYSSDRSVLYNGPDTTNPDYLVIPGTQTTPINIQRTFDSAIPNGGIVSVDYENDENFVVTYVINDVLQQLQARVNKMRHVTADVLVKQATENPLLVEMTVQLLPNSDQVTSDNAIRTSYSVLLDNKGTGEPVHQSDVVTLVQKSTGVSYVVQPLTRMTLQDGATRVRDPIPNNYQFIQSLSQYANAVYILTQELPFATSDGGGDQTVHHGVYMDELIMNESSSLVRIGLQVNQFYIIGNQGAVIHGYSDDATLFPIYITQDAVTAARLRLTANHVLVSLNFGSIPADTPSNHLFAATYIVSGDTQSQDITTIGIEYLTPGTLTITYKTAS
jgi:hypothetical protein